MKRSFWILAIVLFLSVLVPSLSSKAGQPLTFEWDYPNTVSDLAGFYLYRSSTSGELFGQNAKLVVQVTNYPQTTRTCIEKNVPNGIWYWRMTAKDTEGNESDYSNEVPYTVVDTTAPDVPENLRILISVIGNNRIKVSIG